MRIFYDIETVPWERYEDRVAAEAAELDIEDPKETQEKYVASLKEGGAAHKRELEVLEKTDWHQKRNEAQQDLVVNYVEEKLEKAALHWTSGRVVSIAMVKGNLDWCQGSNDEKALLNAFAYEVDALGGGQLVGKNADNFDRPFLIGRYMVHDLGVPWFLRGDDNRLEDVQHIWGRFTRNKSGSLGDIAWALGLDGKDGDWTQVRQWAKDENWDEMGKYNLRDARLCQEIFARYNKVWKVS